MAKKPQIKTLKTFVSHLQAEGFTLDGSSDYTRVQTEAQSYFGGKIPNDQAWKVVNHLSKQVIDVIDDL